MKKQLSARPVDNRYIALAITSLRTARNLLADSGAPKAADAVRRALKSAEGAYRHCRNRQNRVGVVPVSEE